MIGRDGMQGGLEIRQEVVEGSVVQTGNIGRNRPKRAQRETWQRQERQDQRSEGNDVEICLVVRSSS